MKISVLLSALGGILIGLVMVPFLMFNLRVGHYWFCLLILVSGFAVAISFGLLMKCVFGGDLPK